MNEEISRLQQQAEQGDAEAQYKLGCDTYAVGASQSHTEITKGFAFKAAREWLEKAVAQGHAEAEKTLKKLNEDISRQVSWLKQEAGQGNADAQYILSGMYAMGDMGVPQNNKEASEWGLKAVKRGHPKAIEGHAKGIELLKMAAKAGDPNAQFTLGKMYCDGEDVSKSYDEAAKWFQKAVAQGHAEAQHYLAVLYQAGRGVPQNYDEAAELFYKAGAQGLAKAQVQLGILMKTSRLLSAECIQKIAQRGHALAQTILGEMYRNGKGVPQSYTKAFEWYEKAAHQDQVDAQFNIGCMYRDGVGVSKNHSKAIEWFRRAAQQGDSVAQTNLNIMLSQSPGGNGNEKTPGVITIAPRQSAEPKGFGWFVKCLKQYADFEGRARRKEFWMFMLFYWIFLVAWLLLFNSHVVWMLLTVPVTWMHLPALLFKSSAIWYILALLLPSLAVGVRRLHDSGKSGGWMLLLPISFIPAIGIFGTIWLLVLMCLGSQPGTNEHGSNPKGVEKTEFKDAVAKAGIDLQDTNAIYEFADKWIHDESKDRKTGIILLEEVAFRGHAKAMHELYKLCLGNIRNEPVYGIPVDIPKAEFWMQKAMKVDDIEIKRRALCDMGHRTTHPQTKYKLYKESADLGDRIAKEEIGNARNFDEWYYSQKPEFKAALEEAGLNPQDTNAIYEFALEWIRDVSKDRKTGLILLEAVAYRGHARAMDNLYEYYLGNVRHEPMDGMPVDLKKAEYWIKEAMKVDDIEVKGKAFSNMGHRLGEQFMAQSAYPYYAESEKLGYPFAIDLIGNAKNFEEWQELQRRRRG